MRFLARMGDLMLLNLITAVLCIPVITIGASITALHYVCLKLVRGEEGYIFKDYFKSFKENFKQATIIWLIGLVIVGVIVMDVRILSVAENAPKGLGTAILAISIITFVVTRLVFPVLSHFENTVFNTIKNGIFMSLLAAPKVLCMAILEAAPLVGLYFAFTHESASRLIPIILLFGWSLPAYLGAIMYDKTFQKFEPEKENDIVSDEDFHVVVEEEEEQSGESNN